MAVSGSTNITANRNELVYAAFRTLGVGINGETLPSEDLNNGVQALNFMVKALAARGILKHLEKRATVFLQNSKREYSLGLTGDHGTHSYSSTTIRTAEAALQTSLEVTTTTGMTAGDYIGIILDSGNVHWTTISSVTDSDTVVVTTAIPTAAAAGNNVYWYTTKMGRPLRVLHAFVRDGSDDYTVSLFDRDEYWRMSKKDYSSRPTSIYYVNTHPNGTLYINYQPTDLTETLELVYHKSADDFDASTDDADFPQEWYEALKYGTAVRLAPEYNRMKMVPTLKAMEQEAINMAINTTADYPRSVAPTAF